LYRNMTPSHFMTDTDVFNFICGDFSNYDQRIGATWMRAAWQVLVDLLKETIYFKNLSEQDKEAHVNLWDSIIAGVSNPVTWFFGDLLMLDGSNPSGHPLTVIINGIVNYMYMAYAFSQLCPDKSFDDCVRMMTYGDDNMLTVCPSCPEFNQVAITQTLADIGVLYTDADKGLVASHYCSKLTFLKRTWVACKYTCDGVSHVVYKCPLEFSSISKMLSVEFKRDIAVSSNRAISVLMTSMFEHIQYGEEHYRNHVKVCEEFLDEFQLRAFFNAMCPRGWPDYDEYMQTRCEGGNVFKDVGVSLELPVLGELSFA